MQIYLHFASHHLAAFKPICQSGTDPGSGERGGTSVLHIKIHGQFQSLHDIASHTISQTMIFPQLKCDNANIIK
jgi:hypothetical protein